MEWDGMGNCKISVLQVDFNCAHDDDEAMAKSSRRSRLRRGGSGKSRCRRGTRRAESVPGKPLILTVTLNYGSLMSWQ